MKRSRARSRRSPASRTRAGHASRIRYIESSALVAALLEHDLTVMGRLTPAPRYVASALTLAEAGRAIVRARATGRLAAEQEQLAVAALQMFERRCFLVDVNSTVLARVRRPFPIEPIRTLDAVHLATAELLGEPPQLVTIVSRDSRVQANARAMGFIVE